MLLNKYFNLRGYTANSCGPGISCALWSAQAQNRFVPNISLLFRKNYSDTLLIVLTLHIFSKSCTCLNNNIIPNNLFILHVYINHPLAYKNSKLKQKLWMIFFPSLEFLAWHSRLLPYGPAVACKSIINNTRPKFLIFI